MFLGGTLSAAKYLQGIEKAAAIIVLVTVLCLIVARKMRGGWRWRWGAGGED